MANSLPVEDTLAIHELLARYCHGMDAARADLVTDLFTDDAQMQTQVGNSSGKAQIKAWIDERLAQRDAKFQVGHYLLNPLTFAASESEARVRSMLLYTKQSLDFSAPCELVATGIYEDVVVKTAEGWKFKSRKSTLNAPLADRYFN
jgi:hypothetical protein